MIRRKAGSRRGRLVPRGPDEGPRQQTKVTIIRYDGSGFSEIELAAGDDCPGPHIGPTGSGVTWINVDGLADDGFIRKLGECYNLHPLVVDGLLTTDHRPMMEDYGDYI